jgi:hypothetical protein
MKKIIALLSAFSTSAQAHESLVPHAHRHGLSMLAGNDVVVYALLALVAG